MSNKSIVIDKKKALIVGGIITVIYSVLIASILSYAFYKFLPAANFDRLELINIICPLFLIVLGSFLLLFIVMCDAYEQNNKKENSTRQK